jgi:hypothetical protein
MSTRSIGRAMNKEHMYIGQLVNYIHYNGEIERGVVTSIGHEYVFVQFAVGATSKACRAEQLS